MSCGWVVATCVRRRTYLVGALRVCIGDADVAYGTVFSVLTHGA